MKKLIITLLVLLTSGQVYALDSNFSGGTGEEHNPYVISTPDDMAQLASSVLYGNTYEGKYIIVNVNTIDLGEYASFQPIGNQSCRFEGSFDGRGVVIKNLTINSTNDKIGFFGYIGSYSIVKNIIFDESCYVKGGSYTGGLCAINYGTIDHCTSSGNVIGGSEQIGGICAANYGIISSCTNSSVVTGQWNHVGGIAGINYKNISNCINNGQVQCETLEVGGIVGYNSSGRIHGCINNANLESEHTIGGIVGEDLSGTITSCENNGNITSSQNYASGIVSSYHGNSKGTIIKNCINRGTITGSNSSGIANLVQEGSIESCINFGAITATTGRAGGISQSTHDTPIKECANHGIITAKQLASGIVCSGESKEITNCSNYGDIESSGGSASGIASSFGKSTISNCRNEGNIKGNGSTGGIVACMGKGSMAECKNYGRVESLGKSTGGIIGSIGYKGEEEITILRSCENHGIITGNDATGGIVGYNYPNDSRRRDSLLIENCINIDTITGNKYVGGIIAYTHTSIIITKNCSNSGAIVGNSDYVGGICGEMTPREYSNFEAGFYDCNNDGDVIGKNYVGGILGHSDNNMSYNCAYSVIQKCKNRGSVQGTGYTGGILARMLYVGQKCRIKENLNEGNVKSTSQNTGALFGYGWRTDYNGSFVNNYYLPQVVVTIGEKEYLGETPRGVGGNSVPRDIEANCGAVMLKTGSENITFSDPTIKAICVANWDTNGDGELSEDEAAAVTSLNKAFSNNREITSFDELRYFTGLTSITDEDFFCCKALTTITLPKNLAEVPETSFTGCESLESINVAEGNEYYCTIDGILYNKNMSLMLLCPCKKTGDVVIPATVKRLGTNAFYECAELTAITLPGELEELGDAVFVGCTNLTTIHIPASVKIMGLGQVSACTNLESITVDEANTYFQSIDGVLYTKSDLTLMSYPNKKGKEYVVLDGTKGIDAYSFCYTEIEKVTLPASIIGIGYLAFGYCENLKTIVSLNPAPIAAGIRPDIMNDDEYEGVTLMVPYGSKSLYEASNGWNMFTNIVEMPDANAITVTADNLTMEYGDAIPELTYKVEGGVLAGTPELSCEATSTSPAGTYDIIVSKGTVENENVTYVAGKLTINQAPLTISAGTYTKKQYDPMPEIVLTYDGFKNNETAIVLTKQATISCEADEDSTPGEYTITLSGAEAANYEISYVAGKLTVNEPDSFTLAYIVDGELYRSFIVKYKEAITPLEEPTKEGYTFSGWSEIPETMPAHDVTVTGTFNLDSTGINQIMRDENGNTMIFTIDGRRVDKPQKNLNIIRMKDGTTRKVMMK